jgi:1,4-dihydroxy-2-naphthoate octaprenyltransferase
MAAVPDEPASTTHRSGGSVAQVGLWVQGARPKTLGAAVAPVVVGTAAGTLDGPVNWPRALAALVVAVALQVGVNYANDYSDGVRGTDANRKGPVRLTASGLATPQAVKRAAMLSFAVAAVVGAILSLAVNPWLLLVGAAALLAAVTYTGGPKPYGYIGLGEVMVLIFFGFVATLGSAYVQHASLPAAAWPAALAAGLPACGILLANNVRDVDTDRVTGKRTLAVRLGAQRARVLYVACVSGALVAACVCAFWAPWSLLALLAAPLAIPPARAMFTRHDPPGLIAALIGTVRFQLALAALLAAGLWIG